MRVPGHQHGHEHGHCGPDRREGFQGFRAAFGPFGPPFGAGPFGGRGGSRGRARRGDTLTEAGRADAESGPDAPWEDAGRGFDFEAMHEVRQAGAGVMEAFGQVFRTGTPEQREKALAVLGDARRKLYLILADEH
ncbi:hypothetical protein ACFW2T_15320 [Streptomyces sp. NPDC058892]|uniref:hypothetical protein n=1 Tax=unclassified Streptomyces TaxID=2593676 RepID=UPI0036A88F7B